MIGITSRECGATCVGWERGVAVREKNTHTHLEVVRHVVRGAHLNIDGGGVFKDEVGASRLDGGRLGERNVRLWHRELPRNVGGRGNGEHDSLFKIGGSEIWDECGV
tara:strand:- start:289 stop:609 length:321 start_codon:yes stop_codon:yes gene_type:complete